jgi:pimeloyl-ACP methyl ester carboxylesterase
MRFKSTLLTLITISFFTILHPPTFASGYKTMNKKLSFDTKKEATRLKFTEQGSGETIILLSGFPQTRHSWNQILPTLNKKYHVIAIDLPGIGESPILTIEYNTQNIAEIFHEFLLEKKLNAVHLVAHDVGAWVGFTWSALYPNDFLSLTLIDAGIPGITLKETVNLKDFQQRWHFFFQMLADIPAKMIEGKESLYYDWWFSHKVRDNASIPPTERKSYIEAYSRPGRTDAALGYYRAILHDMEINRNLATSPIPVRTLGIGAEFGSVPKMGETIKPFFQHVEEVTIKDSGHFIPEEQPEAFLEALNKFLDQ